MFIDIHIQAMTPGELDESLAALGFVRAGTAPTMLMGFSVTEDIVREENAEIETTSTAVEPPKTEKRRKTERKQESAKPEPTPAPDPEPVSEVSLDDLRKAALDLGKAKGLEAVQRILQLYNAETVKDIPQGEYPTALHDFRDSLH